MNTTLLIMAAGLGSRYGGNKQVDGIGPNGEMLMQYSIYDAVKAGFDKVVVIIKPEHQELIEGICKNIKGAELVFAYQEFSSIPSSYTVPADRVKPFGTVHAVLCAKDVINEPFAIINADDYYGADAFVKMYDELQQLAAGQGTMVAYLLKNTVSKNGAVTRGVCSKDESDKLVAVKETYSITVDANGRICDADDGELDGESLVSMNMWGFLPTIFEDAGVEFEKFLSEIPEGNIKAEYALPTMVDKFIKDGTLEISVLSTDSVWFGVTYKEDKAFVAGELLKMHKAGIYPEKL